MGPADAKKRRIAVVSAGRSDFSIYLPLLQEGRNRPRIEMNLIASGAHLRAEHGMTVNAIRASGFEPAAELDTLGPPGADDFVSSSIARGIEQFAAYFRREKYDLLMVLGDRFEMLCPVLAALPRMLPVAHIHGGEETVGAFDNQIRHAITKLSHLHFVSAEAHRRRVISMGEDPSAVFVSGAPALDQLESFESFDEEHLKRTLDLESLDGLMLFTYHPETLGDAATSDEVRILSSVILEQSHPVVITAPNPDPGGALLKEAFEKLANGSGSIRFRNSLGTTLYYSLMKRAALVCGNSSSGIIEAASMKIPVVNIGDRQKGRVRAENVLDVPLDAEAVRGAINRARSAPFKKALEHLENPYWHGGVAKIILDTLSTVPLGTELIRKRFHEGAP